MAHPLRRQIGARLRVLRLATGRTQADLARTIGAEPREVSEYERGRSLPRLARMARLADVLGVEVREFFAFTDGTPRIFSPDVLMVALLVEHRAVGDPSFPRRALKILTALE